MANFEDKTEDTHRFTADCMGAPATQVEGPPLHIIEDFLNKCKEYYGDEFSIEKCHIDMTIKKDNYNYKANCYLGMDERI